MPFAQVVSEFLAGSLTYPWTLLASLFLGAFLLTMPVTLGLEGPLYFSGHVVGCLVITIAVTALAEVTRAVRFFNVPLGLWVAVSPFLLAGAVGLSATVHVALGLAVAALKPAAWAKDEGALRRLGPLHRVALDGLKSPR